MKTAIDLLAEWTENTNWKNYLLNIVLQNYEVDIDDITTEIIDIIKSNKKIELLPSKCQETIQTKLYVNEIKNPVNINALCSEAECKLGKNLNVFYGENGTGKSSYVKIFRKLAENYYTNEKNLSIKSNIYNYDKSTNKQTISVSYSCDDNECYVECIDINVKQNELSKINVFDSYSITPLLNDDLTFSILPQGLNYFSQLTDIIDRIKGNIKKIIIDIESEQNRVFSDSSFLIIADDIKSITTNVKGIAKLDDFLKEKYMLPEDTEGKIDSLNQKIKEIQNTNTADRIKILDSQKLKLEAIMNGFELLATKVTAEVIDDINLLIKQYDEITYKEIQYNEEFNKKIKHVACVNNEWTNFINAAIQFYNSIDIELPEINDKCIFCGQPLYEEHINLIDLCFQHVNSDNNKFKKEIYNKLQTYSVPEVAITLLDEDEKLFDQDKKFLIEKLKTTIQLVDKNREILNESIENKKKVSGESVINFEAIINEVTQEIKDIEGRITSLGKTNQEVIEVVNGLESQRNALIIKKKVNESKELLIKWFEYKIEIDLLSKISNKFSTTSLTTKSKEAFKEIVAGDYISIFDEYCNRLGVPHVNISLSSQKGQSKRGKYVVNQNIKVTDIMSEGEQKAIALAEFATDLSIRENFCTTIFDDPVTSFDYKRAEKIANMIYELSKERQVIVFTHNIMFYYYLYNSCEKDKNRENKFFKIDEFDRDNKGLISVSAEGRLENLKEVTKKIKSYFQEINSKTCLGDELDRTFKTAYSYVRTWCELIVEEGFLRNSIRRYEPNIMFNPLLKITPEFVEFIPKVSALFDKSCRYMSGHSQPTETQNIKPSREEFSIDYDFIINLYEKYKQ